MKKRLGLVLALLLVIPSVAMAIDIANVQLGGQVLMRGYALENMWFYNSDNEADQWDVFRIKGSLNMNVDLGDDVSAFIQLTNQTYGEGVSDDLDNQSNKVFLDNAYILAKNILGPISLKIGRQNMIYGSGFVILDGQSQFASTSIYFDGVKATADLSENISIDAFYMKDQENTRSDLVDDDVTLMGLYLTTKGCPVIGGKQEFYALNREDENSTKDIWTYGIRVSDKFDFGLDYAGEVAIQTGTSAVNGIDQDALGYKLDLGYTFDIDLKPRIYGQYAFLSGDEAGSTDEWEGWDVMYGGWPQFGDLLAWAYVFGPSAVADPAASTGGEAAYTNLIISTIGLSCNIDDKVFPNFSYSQLRFDEDNNAVVYGVTDDDFGKYYQLNVKYQYSKMLGFSAYYAIIQPGDGIEMLLGSDDDAQEFYWEASVKF